MRKIRRCARGLPSPCYSARVPSKQPTFAAAWYAQWSSATAALDQVHADELRALTDAEALRRIDALLSMGSGVLPDDRRTGSGFVVQQALFARLRRER